MLFDLPTTTIALVFVGGFAVCTANAALRREPFWALGAVAALGLMSDDANARYLDLGAASLHHPPAVGLRIEALLRVIIAA